MRPTALFCALATATIMSGSWSSAATANQDEPTPTPDSNANVSKTFMDASGVMHYAFDPEQLPGAEIITQKGVSLAGKADTPGCRFEDEDAGQASGGRVQVMSEVTFDLATCTRQLAVATYALDAVPATVAKDLDGELQGMSSAEEGTSEGTRPSGITATAANEWWGSIRATVEDPAQINVTTTRSKVTWGGGSCLWWADPLAYWSWYTRSGWGRIDHWWRSGLTCYKAWANTYGKFRNGRFCATIDTYTRHNKTYFEGRRYGGWYWAYDMDKWGGCSSWLHYEHNAITP